MARGRMISKSLSTSVKRNALMSACPKMAEFCEFLFVMLVIHADDQGRLPGDEFTVKMQVDPVSRRKLPDFVAALHLLHQVNLIIWYQIGGQKLIQIVKFAEHQDLKGHNLRPGKLSPCPGSEAFVEQKHQLGEVGENPPKPPLSKEKLSKEKLSKENDCAVINTAPILLTFPTQGPVTSWTLSEAQMAKWQEQFPALDVLGECRAAQAWCDANPQKRKTASGMARFLVRWFSNSVNNGRGRVAGPQQGLSKVTEFAMRAIREAQ